MKTKFIFYIIGISTMPLPMLARDYPIFHSATIKSIDLNSGFITIHYEDCRDCNNDSKNQRNHKIDSKNNRQANGEAKIVISSERETQLWVKAGSQSFTGIAAINKWVKANVNTNGLVGLKFDYISTVPGHDRQSRKETLEVFRFAYPK